MENQKKIINCFLKIFFKPILLEYLLHFPNILGSCAQTIVGFFFFKFFFNKFIEKPTQHE